MGISVETLATCCLWPTAVSLVAAFVQAHARDRRLTSGDLLIGLSLAVGAVGTIALFLLQMDTLPQRDAARGWMSVAGMVSALYFFAESIRRRKLLAQYPLRRRARGVWLCNVYGFVYLVIAAVAVDNWTKHVK